MIYMKCQGEAKPGTPTLIVETGIWDCSKGWQHVQPELAKFTRVCTYDRAGYGLSEPGAMPRTFHNMVRELKTLLVKKEIEPPYIFIGHSLGGAIARYYHSQYPEDVAGMVFVDALHLTPPEQPRSLLFRIVKMALYCLAYLFSGLKTCLDEWDQYETSFQQLQKQHKSLKDIPVTWITRDLNLPGRPWMSTQERKRERDQMEALLQEIKRDMPHARLVMAEGSSHVVHKDRPDLIIEEVRKIL